MNQNRIQDDNHANNFDLIRLFLAGLVVFSHSWKFVEGNYNHEPLYFFTGHFRLGDMAVNGFFLLSGYLIFASWLKKPHIIKFARNRVLRIFPGFVIASFISVLLGSFIYHHDWLPYLFRRTVLIDAFSLGEPVGPFNAEQLNVSLWTIRYEFICYLMVAGMGILGLLKKNWPTVVLWLLAMGISISGCINENSATGTLTRFISYFSTGGIFYLFNKKIRFQKKYFFIAMAGVLLGFLYVPLSKILLPVAGGYLLFYTGFLKNNLLNRLRPAHDISYGLYLYGWPVQKYLVVSYGISIPLVLFFIALPVAALFGLLSWKLIEEPCMRMRTLKSPFLKVSGKKST